MKKALSESKLATSLNTRAYHLHLESEMPTIISYNNDEEEPRFY